MPRKKLTLAWILVASAVAVAGCGGGSSSSLIPTLSAPLADAIADPTSAAGRNPLPTAVVSPASGGAGNPGVGNNGNDKPVGNAQGDPRRPPADDPDTTAPVVNITAPAAGWYRTGTLPTLAYTAVDDRDPAPTVVVTGWSTGEGRFTVVVTATDAAGNAAADSVAYDVDDTAPSVTANAAPTANAGGWNNTAVTASFGADDPGGSGVVSVTPPVVVTAEGTTTVTGTAADRSGNVGSASVTVNIDLTGPAIELSAPYEGAVYFVGEPVPASFGAFDALSDIESVVGTVPEGALVDTATPGVKSFTATATDVAGNVTAYTVTYEVVE